MGVPTLIFWLFAVAAVVGGLGVVVSRKPINNVLSLVLVMISLAIEFLLLSAQFVFAVQVIVYAGAVMVLFLFVVALLGPIREERTLRLRHQLLLSVIAGLVFGGLLYAELQGITYRAPDPAAGAAYAFGSVQAIGVGLFTTYLYPFELTSILLLVAAVGAIYLSRHDEDELPVPAAAVEDPPPAEPPSPRPRRRQGARP